MKTIRSRILCVLLALAVLVPAITGLAQTFSLHADALGQDIGFSNVNWPVATAKSTTRASAEALYAIIKTQTTPDVAQRCHDLIFKATYRPNEFGGSNWTKGNSGSGITSMYDSGLGMTVKWNWTSWGCFSYGMFTSQYARQSNGTAGKRQIGTSSKPTAAQLKAFIESYADPGEHIHFHYTYKTANQHSICYLASDKDGIYFLSSDSTVYGIHLYYLTYAKFSSILRYVGKNVVELYDTNKGKDSVSQTNIAPVAQVTFNDHVYTLYTGAEDQAQAAAYAETAGGYLATLTSADEQLAVNSLFAQTDIPAAWIGLQYEQGVGTWTNDEWFLYKNFATDIELTDGKGFVFTDKVADGTLTGRWGTCTDSLTVGEQTYKASAFGFIVETGDAFPVSVAKVSEVVCDENDTMYVLFDGSLDYAYAKRFCEEMGGELAVISDETELGAVMNLTMTADASYRIGAKMNDKDEWVWEDGSVTGAYDLPAGYEGNELMFVADSTNGILLTNGAAETLCGFICEIKLQRVSMGDVDGDGVISASDARDVLRHVVSLETDSTLIEQLGDANGDNTIDAGDARVVLRGSVGLEDCKSWNTVLISPFDQ